MSVEISNRRFAGIANLYGQAGFEAIQRAHICVIGVGGVGSWAIESLARSGIGAITMIDMDVVAESNINRQLHATSDTLGRDKADVMCERIAAINADCRVTVIDEFITLENMPQFISADFDFVIDCIDDFRKKAGLIAFCKINKIKIITLGGAGGQIDPSKIRQTDLSSTQHDSLLAQTRKLLRQKYSFARNPKRVFSIPCVFSDEQACYPDGNGGTRHQKTIESNEFTSSALSCAGGLGSITHVTASFAFYAAAYVLKHVTSKASVTTPIVTPIATPISDSDDR